MAEQVYETLLAQPDSAVKSGRLLLAAMRDAGIQFTTAKGREALDDLLFAGRITEVPGKKNAVGYKAVKVS